MATNHQLAEFGLRIGLFRFRIVPLESLLVPAVNKGNMLRGGFGHAFRRLCCMPQCKDTRACPVGLSCPYKAIFEPSPPPGAESLSKNQDIPRPFVFRAPLTQQTRFEKDEAFDFELVLVGRALDCLPYFVLSFRELAAEGLGLNRAKCRLDRVEQIAPGETDNWQLTPAPEGPTPNGQCRDCQRPKIEGPRLIYSSSGQLFHRAENHTAAQWIATRLVGSSAANGQLPTANGSGIGDQITIRFLTPTFLRVNGEVVRCPQFHHVFKRLRDRINALSTFYGDGPLEANFRELGEHAEAIRSLSAEANWVERARTSSRTRQRHDLSGFVGQVTYEGDLEEVVPWLALGEVVHVGKHTAWGNGWMDVALSGGLK